MKKHLFTTTLVRTIIVSAFCVTAVASAAPPVQFGANGHHYNLINGNFTWDNANIAAQQQTYLGVTGHLATITSAAEDTFVYNQVLLPNIAAPDVFHDAWLGGYQPLGSQEPSGSWTWVTGESWGYTNWAGGEPNNGVGFNSSPEDVLALRGIGLWNDSPRDFAPYPQFAPPIGYLVEFPTVPEPSTTVLFALGAGAFLVSRRKR